MSEVEDNNYRNESKKKNPDTRTGVNVTHEVTITRIEDTDSEGDKAQKKKVIKYSVIGGGILVAVILIIVLSITLSGNGQSGPLPPYPPTPAPIPDPIFIDVDPFQYQEYNLYTSSSVTSQDWIVGTTLQQSTKLRSGYSSNVVGDPLDGRTYQPVNPKLINEGANNRYASQVKLEFALIDNYQAQLIVTDPDNSNNYNVSDYAFARPVQSFEARFTQVGFVQAPSPNPYSFNFSNIYNGETLISTYKRKLVISEKFSEIGFVLPTNRIFGLGQHNSQFQLSNGTYTLWAKGRASGLPDDNQEGGLNGPHIHPFILCQTQKKDFIGIFFAGSAAQSFEIIQYANDPRVILNYISLGGQLEIYFMMRGTAQEILARYHAIIGYSYVPPYFALGFFQGSNAYQTVEQAQAVVQGYSDANMALEGLILDNYYQANQVFTVDQTAFKDLNAYSDTLKAGNQHILLGIESGISSATQGYKYYDDLISSTCVVKSSVNAGSNLIGYQQTTVVYPDYQCANNIVSFFQNSLEDLDSVSHFSGLLLQNNELYSFVDGEVSGSKFLRKQVKRNLDSSTQVTEENSGSWNGSYQINPDQSYVSTYNLPYVPGYEWSGNLDNQAISLNATHQDRGKSVQEYFVHNINGHMNLKEVFQALNKSTSLSTAGQRPFLFTDSTWAGSGHFGAVALSDMWRKWSNLRTTISQAMSFSMYGISNVASDVCGSLGPIDDELCGRWAQLSAFLPLMRGYYNATFQNQSTMADETNPASELYKLTPYQNEFTASSALNQRLQYTRYIYSQMYKVYLKGGALVYPLFFDYPEDDNTFEDIEHTYMLGDAIKVSPVLEASVTDKFQAYFPKGIWADLNQQNVSIASMGEKITLDQSYAYTNIHLKEGKIIPFQENSNQYKQTKDLLTKEKVSFIIHRDTSDYAEGFTLVDDGSSQSTWDNVDFTFWKLRYAEKSINFWVEWGDFEYTPPTDMTIDQLKSIRIVNAEDLSGTNFACYLGTTLNPVNISYSYNPYTKVLTLSPEDSTPLRFKDIGFIKFGNSFTEPNFCDYNSAFTYKLVDIDIQTKTKQFQAMTIASLQQSKKLSELVVSVRLMDNTGTISLNITTTEDYNNGGMSKFKPPHVADISQYPESEVTLSLDQFITFTSNPFSYTIFKQDSPDDILYQSDPHKLYFEDYMIFDSGIFSLNPLTNYPLMGLGERAGSLFYTEDGIHSRYTFDQANPIDDGKPPGRNLYGFQPVYYYQSTTTDWVGVFDLNSYATDYLLQFNNGTKTQITKVQIGGMIQKYFFVGGKPDDVIKKYVKLVGMPVMPPIWAFGWQQCRFGWTTDQKWIDVVHSYSDNNLPLDTMWADIDYMDDYKIFTISQSRYSNLATYVDYIHSKGMTFVPIMDVGVAVRANESYMAYENGMSQDIFIKQYDNSAPLTAGVWCGHAYFPDFFHPKINDYWHASFDYLTTEYNLTFDGIWIDMNEATNFCNGYCIPSERPIDSLRNKPYYVPGWRDLEDKALGVDGLHQKVWNGQDLHEYDVHNMYSLMQVKSTSEYLSEKKGLRPFVLSRSNFPGLGKYGHHWIGDNWSTVDYMSVSVDGIYSYNLFGLPFMGSDICGFDGDAPADLCTRWHQLGSLYPFSRNHNQNASTSQEPYVFDTPYERDPSQTYMSIIRTALRNRYSVIKYYYSRFQDMHTFGGSFFRPLFFEFVADPQAYKNLEINILLGDALKASIQVTSIDEAKTPTTVFYFPEGTWCQILPAITSKSQCFNSPSTGTNLTLPSYLTDYYVHLRGGFIVPTQAAIANDVNTTKDLEKLSTDFVILPLALNTALVTNYATTNAQAVGYIYFDDGVTLDQTPTRFELSFVHNAVNEATFSVTSIIGQTENSYKSEGKQHESIGTIQILFATNCFMNGATTSAVATLNDLTQVTLKSPAVYDATTDALTLSVSDVDGKQISLYNLKSIHIQ